MEPLWSPVVANNGNQSQIGRARNRRKQRETVAVGCNQLRPGLNGKGRVDPTSLLLKRGRLPRSAKSVESHKTRRAAGDSTATLTCHVLRRRRVRRFFVPAGL